MNISSSPAFGGGRPVASRQPGSRPDDRTADDLSRELREQRERSLKWQLLERSFATREDSHRPAEVDGHAATEDAGTRPQQAAAPGPRPPDTSIDAEFTHAEIHATQVQISADGVRIASVDLTYDRLVLRRAAEPPVQKSDPLALDLDGDGRIATTGVSAGRRFDLDADGQADQSSVVTGNDAFLALDRNGNGIVDDGSELFGDQTGAVNGFEALRRYDGNVDGRIDAADAIFSELRLATWNADGSQRLMGLREGGVVSVSLAYSDSDIAVNAHDRIAQVSSFERSDGSTALAADLLLGFTAIA